MLTAYCMCSLSSNTTHAHSIILWNSEESSLLVLSHHLPPCFEVIKDRRRCALIPEIQSGLDQMVVCLEKCPANV